MDCSAEFISKNGEGWEAVASTAVASVSIHDDVGIIRCPNEMFHEEPAMPMEVVSFLVQVFNLVILVHVSHVPEAVRNVRVPGGRTLIQNCVKKAGSLLAWCSQPQAVASETVQACLPHACSPRWIFLSW